MALSGTQWTINYGGRTAIIAAVGGGLRSLTVDGKAYVDDYGDDEIAPGWAGHVLAPWPGRIRDGRYGFDGAEYQLPWNEPETRTALHGLVGWLAWHADDVSDSSVTVECELPAQPGYPFPLLLRTRWSVGPYGLRAAHTVSNIGVRSCPFGLGVHPYLRLPGTELADAMLRIPATVKLGRGERNLPQGEIKPDFTVPTAIEDTVLDDSYGGLERGDDGIARVELSGDTQDSGVTVWMDASFNWVHVYTADKFDGDRARRSIAIEPMTCPPNALADGIDVVELSPGEAWAGTWGIAPR